MWRSFCTILLHMVARSNMDAQFEIYVACVIFIVSHILQYALEGLYNCTSRVNDVNDKFEIFSANRHCR